MKYMRQNRSYNCGPVVLLNALKWAGHNASRRKDLKWLTKLVYCGANGQSGTWTLDLQNGLMKLEELEIKNVLHVPTLKEIDQELSKGRAVILRYFHSEGGHYTLIVGKTKKYYTLVNDSRLKAVIKRSRKTMSKMLKENRVEPGLFLFSVAWSIEPL